MKQINSIDELKEEVSNENNEYFIALNFGGKSSKHIANSQNVGKFWILNYIDGTEQNLTPDELNDRGITNIGYAIENGAFYMEDI